MTYTGVDAAKASSVFETFQVYSPDGMKYLPQFFVVQAVREMGYCPTVQFLQDVLERVVPVGECMTFPIFLNLCEAMKSTQHLDAATIKHQTEAFDVRGSGMVRRSEFRTIFATAAAADLSAGEIEVILELLDPLHTDTVQLRSLQKIMRRYADGDAGLISLSGTPHSWRRNDRHMQSFPTSVSEPRRRGDYAAQDRTHLEWKPSAPMVATAPADTAGSESASPLRRAAPPTPYNSGVVTRATSLQPRQQSAEHRSSAGRRGDAGAPPDVGASAREPFPPATASPSVRELVVKPTPDVRSSSGNSPPAQAPSEVVPLRSERNGAALSDVPLNEMRDVALENRVKDLVITRKREKKIPVPTVPEGEAPKKGRNACEKCCHIL